MRLGLFLLVLGALLLAAPRAPFSDEVRAQASTALALVTQGSLDVAADGDNRFTHLHGGRRYASAAPGLALWLAPAALLGRLVVQPRARQLLQGATAALAAALVCLMFAAQLRRRGVRARAAVIATLALAFSTGLFAAGRVPDGAALEALLLYFAFVRVRRPGAAAALQASTALAALVLIDASLALPAAVLLLGAALLQPGRGTPVALLALAGPLLVGAALLLVHRAHVGWFPPPPGDLLQGLDGLLLSTGKSVFLYSPLLILIVPAARWWWRTARREAALGLLLSAATVLTVAALDGWHGDPTWGPRRLTPILPIAAEPIALWLDARRERWARGAAGALLALGLLIQALGALWSPSAFPQLVTRVRLASGAPDWFVDPSSELHFIPQFSPITGHAWMAWHALRRGALDANPPWHLLVQETPKLDAEWAMVKIDWFALEAPRGLKIATLGLGALLLLAGIALTARRLRMLA